MPTVAYDLSIMSKFNPGDHVERIDTLVPIYMKSGRVLSVLSHADSNEELTEYDVEFKYAIARFYEGQLKLVAAASSAARSE